VSTPYEPSPRDLSSHGRFGSPQVTNEGHMARLAGARPQRVAAVCLSVFLACVIGATSVISEPAAFAAPSQWFLSPSPDSGKGINILSSVSCRGCPERRGIW